MKTPFFSCESQGAELRTCWHLMSMLGLAFAVHRVARQEAS